MANTFIKNTRKFLKAFRQAYITYDIIEEDDFNDYNGRLLRYAIYFSFYENSVYDRLRNWAIAYRTNYGLYQYIRNIYNPAFRLTEFWRTVIWGGLLDNEAGEQGAIPVKDASTALRKAIATTWKDSNMPMIKDLITLDGCSMGDVGIKVIDDVDRKRVYLDVVHPSNIRDIIIDNRGYCQGYVLEEERKEEGGRDVTFVEVCEKVNSQTIRYTTYKDGKPFAWNGRAATWTADYGFVPFAMIRHNWVGGTYGWAEIHPQRSKIHEVDEQASKLHDYTRKAIDPVWLFNFRKPKNAPNFQDERTDAATDNPQPGREEMQALYVPDARAKAQALVTENVDIDKVAGIVKDQISELERELPELQMDIWTVGGYTTGKALRTARQRVEKKALFRRPAYDHALVRLNGMAVAIGGERGYPDYSGFNLGSFERGELEHSIMTERPVFDTDALEEVERKQVFWSTVLDAYDKGMDIEPILIDLGKTEQWAKKFMSTLPEKTQDVETTVPQGEQDVQNTQTDSVGATQRQ